MQILFPGCVLTLCALFASCTTTKQAVKKEPEPRYTVTPLYATAAPGDARIKISLLDQTARLMNKKGDVLIETQVSTGMDMYPTPVGNFSVLEKLPLKRSNEFGSYVDKDTKKILVPFAWEHTGPKPPNSEYLGIKMHNWMRLTWSGVGMHVGGQINGRANSHGCIRVPAQVMPLIYEKCRVGTPVEITG